MWKRWNNESGEKEFTLIKSVLEWVFQALVNYVHVSRAIHSCFKDSYMNKTPAKHRDIFRQKYDASARVRTHGRVCQADALPTVTRWLKYPTYYILVTSNYSQVTKIVK